MTQDPVDRLLDRLQQHGLRPNGADRWRSRCPAHGGSNRSTLSIGRGDTGAALFKCFHGCTPEQITRSLGLELSDLFPERGSSGSPAKRRRMMSASQALDLVHREVLIVFVAASDIVKDRKLAESDWDRLQDAAAAIGRTIEEVYTS